MTSQAESFQLVPGNSQRPWHIQRIYFDNDGLRCTELFAEFWSELGEMHAKRVFAFLNNALDTKSIENNGILVNGVNVRVLREAYDWTLDVDGEVHGLTAGDHGYEPTGIKIADFKKYWGERDEVADELALIQRAARDETLSDGIVRVIAGGLDEVTPEDIGWAQRVIAAEKTCGDGCPGCAYCQRDAGGPSDTPTPACDCKPDGKEPGPMGGGA